MHSPGPGEHVLDVETLWLSSELPRGWGDQHRMRVSCCVVHDLTSGKELVFAIDDVPGTASVEMLYHFLEACRSEGCTLVGHNLRAFDWAVLAGEFEARGLIADHRGWHPARARLVDTLATLHARLGWRPSLQSLALHNLGEGKSLDGSLAPQLWRQGRRAEVVAYCRRDVDLTRRVWQKGREHGEVVVGVGADGAEQRVAVAW